MIKPLFIAWRIYPNITGGIEVFNYHFIKWLYIQDDVSPILVTATNTTVPKGIRVKRFHIKLKHFGNMAKIFAIFRACFSGNGKNKVLFLSFSKSSWKVWIGYSFVASLLRIPYIIYIHGGGMYPWKHKKIMRKVFCNARSIFCVSPKQKKEYEQRTGMSIEVLAPIVPFSNFSRDRAILNKTFYINDTSFIFLYLGSIRQVKGTDVLIKAFVELGNYTIENDIHLLLVGAGDTIEYESMYIELPCANNIHFVGKVSNEIVGKYYSSADCFVLPSRIEGMPIALIEALHNKLPTIVSDLPTIPNLLVSRESCLKFPPEDYHALADAMKYIFSDSENRDQIAHKGHEVYKENWFSDHTFVTLLEAMRNAVE